MCRLEFMLNKSTLRRPVISPIFRTHLQRIWSSTRRMRSLRAVRQSSFVRLIPGWSSVGWAGLLLLLLGQTACAQSPLATPDSGEPTPLNQATEMQATPEFPDLATFFARSTLPEQRLQLARDHLPKAQAVVDAYDPKVYPQPGWLSPAGHLALFEVIVGHDPQAPRYNVQDIGELPLYSAFWGEGMDGAAAVLDDISGGLFDARIQVKVTEKDPGQELELVLDNGQQRIGQSLINGPEVGLSTCKLYNRFLRKKGIKDQKIIIAYPCGIAKTEMMTYVMVDQKQFEALKTYLYLDRSGQQGGVMDWDDL